MGAPARRVFEFAEPPIGVDWSLAFTRPETAAAHLYWDSIRGERTMPRRSELIPREMRAFLTYVNLVDVRTDSSGAFADYEVALQASHGVKVLGSLVRRTLDQALSKMTARRLRQCLDHARVAARPVRINTRVTGGNKFWLDSECLFAPLGDDQGRVVAIMWVFVSWNAIDD